ncbi:uncharacterized protein [Branchiostoma lanceolatum]|uniref:uncharacterized protein n=1 Tax=Branchiostoma lanceolatum TaxID=7740 RepID=UPI00345390FD
MQVIPGVTIFVNPDDPHLVAEVTGDGKVIQVQGDKTEDGDATSVESLTKTTSCGDQTIVGFSPDSALVDTVVTSSGVSMTFTWIDDKVFVTASAKNASFELNVLVDLEPSDLSTGTPETVTETPDYDYGVTNSGGDSAQTEVSTTQEPQTALPTSESEPVMAGQSLRLPVHVTLCNLSAEHVTVRAFGYKGVTEATDTSSLDPDVEYRVVPTGKAGKFVIVVPTSPANTSAEVTRTVCGSVTQVLGGVCSALLNINAVTDGTICNEVADAANLLTTQTGGESALVMAACSGGFACVEAFCDAVGFNATEEEAMVSSDLCERVTETVDSFSPEPVLVVPKAVFSSGEEVSAPGMIVTPGNANQTLPAFSISFGGAHVISSVVITPRDPLPGQDYVVRAQFGCTDPTTVVTMTIVGTDGYDDEVQCTGAIAGCTLRVPGADALVRDRITVSIRSATMPVLSREYIVIF